MRKATPNIAQSIKSIIRKIDPNAKVYLFGSRARGHGGNDSDWDVLILLSSDDINSDLERKITSPLFELEFETGEVISPNVYSQNEWYNKHRVTPFYSNVMREGKLL